MTRSFGFFRPPGLPRPVFERCVQAPDFSNLARQSQTIVFDATTVASAIASVMITMFVFSV